MSMISKFKLKNLLDLVVAKIAELLVTIAYNNSRIDVLNEI